MFYTEALTCKFIMTGVTAIIQMIYNVPSIFPENLVNGYTVL